MGVDTKSVQYSRGAGNLPRLTSSLKGIWIEGWGRQRERGGWRRLHKTWPREKHGPEPLTTHRKAKWLPKIITCLVIFHVIIILVCTDSCKSVNCVVLALRVFAGIRQLTKLLARNKRTLMKLCQPYLWKLNFDHHDRDSIQSKPFPCQKEDFLKRLKLLFLPYCCRREKQRDEEAEPPFLFTP